jgi:hypothetical protein
MDRVPSTGTGRYVLLLSFVLYAKTSVTLSYEPSLRVSLCRVATEARTRSALFRLSLQPIDSSRISSS